MMAPLPESDKKTVVYHIVWVRYGTNLISDFTHPRWGRSAALSGPRWARRFLPNALIRKLHQNRRGASV
jgi:hypothetical protein